MVSGGGDGVVEGQVLQQPLLQSRYRSVSVVMGEHAQGQEEEEDTQQQQQEKTLHYRVYPYRWIILGLYCLLVGTNTLMWLSLSTITNDVESYYGVGSSDVNMLALVFYIVYVPLALPLTWMLDRFGLRVGMYVAAATNGAGGLIRIIGTGHGGYIWLLIGNVVSAISLPILMAIPTKLTAGWFADKERALSTSIAIVFNQSGQAIAFVLSETVVVSQEDIPRFIIGIGVAGGIVSVLVFLFFRKEPPTPPSASSVHQSDTNILRDLKILVKSKTMWSLIVAFSLSQGGFWVLSTLLDEVLTPINYTDNSVSNAGIVILILGIPGMLIGGFIVSRTQMYKLVMNVCLLVNSLALLWLVFLSKDEDKYPQVMAVMVIAGIFTSTLQPISLELAVEISYPVSEVVSGGFLMFVGQLFAIAFTFASDGLQEKAAPHMMTNAVWMFFAAALIGFLSFLLFFQWPFWAPGRYNRHENDLLNREDENSISLVPSHSSLGGDWKLSFSNSGSTTPQGDYEEFALPRKFLSDPEFKKATTTTGAPPPQPIN